MVAVSPIAISAEDIENMSQEELLAAFDRLRQAAAAKGVALPKVSNGTGGGAVVSFDAVLSRAGIHARANRAFVAAQERNTATETAFNTARDTYLRANNLEELTPELQSRIDEHVAAALARAESGYAKTSQTNKGRARGSNVSEATAEGETSENTEGSAE